MTISTSKLQEKYGFESPFTADPLVKKGLAYIINNGNTILDIGCGEGADSAFFAKNGFRVKALDQNADYLSRFKAYIKDQKLSNIIIENTNVINYPYPINEFDVVNCILIGCCMRRSEFEIMLSGIKKTVKHGGIIIMSLRNYLDLEMEDLSLLTHKIEPNTFLKNGDCCSIRYFIEKDRLRNLFAEFEILYYYEGLAPDKYLEVEKHGDSYIICRKHVS
jgi:SAM-dependent methyltransferase